MEPYADDFSARFERLELDVKSFSHRDHVAAAYAMLELYPFMEAVSRTVETLRSMARSVDAESHFHTTITLAFMAVIAERMEAAEFRSFDDFSEANPDLLSAGVLERFYSPERLASPLARRAFVMPDAQLPAVE